MNRNRIWTLFLVGGALLLALLIMTDWLPYLPGLAWLQFRVE